MLPAGWEGSDARVVSQLVKLLTAGSPEDFKLAVQQALFMPEPALRWTLDRLAQEHKRKAAEARKKEEKASTKALAQAQAQAVQLAQELSLGLGFRAA